MKPYHMYESWDLFTQGYQTWAYPLILKLEETKNHDGITWVVHLIQQFIGDTKSPPPNEYHFWLNELLTVIESATYDNIEGIQAQSQRIFTTKSRQIWQPTLISRLYVAEGHYRNGNYRMYLRFTSDAVDHLNENINYDNRIGYKKIMEYFINYISR
ncbi:MAG: hypothetical protein AAGI23_02235 [Bacteroidota bacterium]